MAPSAAVNCATQSGTRTDIRPLLSAITLMLLAVSPDTQPPQINPIAIAATAPKAIPWRKRVRASPRKIAGIFILVSFVGALFRACFAGKVRQGHLPFRQLLFRRHRKQPLPDCLLSSKLASPADCLGFFANLSL